MAKDVSFALDTKGGEEILQRMALPIVERSANAIASRARSMASSLSSQPPDVEVKTEVKTIRRGVRAVSTVSTKGQDEHQNYIGFQALTKAKDAGRVN